jgi:hypothetical protein
MLRKGSLVAGRAAGRREAGGRVASSSVAPAAPLASPPTWRIDAGKAGLGALVSHSLKSLWTFGGGWRLGGAWVCRRWRVGR